MMDSSTTENRPTEGLGRSSLRLLSSQDLRKVHQAALEILERIGMLVEHAGCRAMLEGEGARVDHTAHRVRFPAELVEAKLQLIPKRMEYHGRTPEFDFACTPDGDIYAQVGGGSKYAKNL